MSWTSPATVTVGQVLTAAFWNTHVRDNEIDLDRRTTITGALVATSQGTTTTTYSDLATTGPAVTVTIGSTGKALVAIRAFCDNPTASQVALMSFAISGASTVAAADTTAISCPSASNVRAGETLLISGLTVGSNTFTAKYRATGGTATFADRNLLVTPLGS